MTTVFEPARETPISASCDVLVAGGGFGGIAAALAAARNGKKVLLVEKEYQLGGLGTAGLVTFFLPLCDGNGRQVTFGLGEELLRLSVKYGCEAQYPSAWLDGGSDAERAAQRFEVRYNPSLFAIAAEQLLLKEGVEILYGTSIVETAVENGKITAVFIENKSGRSAITLQCAVDATGDADLCRFAGAKCAVHANGNILAAWYYYSNETDVQNLQILGAADDPNGKKKEELSARRFTGLDGKEISEFVQLSHASTLNHLLKQRQSHPTQVPTTIATIPQLRMTRRLVGCYEQRHEETFAVYADSVGMFGSWRQRGPVYELPFGALYGKEVRNLLTAGRCISVADDLWDLTRVIPVCCVSGEAAGTAAALCGDDVTALPVEVLQAQLVKQGVRLHL